MNKHKNTHINTNTNCRVKSQTPNNQVSAERPQAIAQILIAIGAIEVAGLVANEGKAAGDFGFDPLNLKPKTDEAFEELQLKEIKNGRCVFA